MEESKKEHTNENMLRDGVETLMDEPWKLELFETARRLYRLKRCVTWYFKSGISFWGRIETWNESGVIGLVCPGHVGDFAAFKMRDSELTGIEERIQE